MKDLKSPKTPYQLDQCSQLCRNSRARPNYGAEAFHESCLPLASLHHAVLWMVIGQICRRSLRLSEVLPFTDPRWNKIIKSKLSSLKSRVTTWLSTFFRRHPSSTWSHLTQRQLLSSSPWARIALPYNSTQYLKPDLRTATAQEIKSKPSNVKRIQQIVSNLTPWNRLKTSLRKYSQSSRSESLDSRVVIWLTSLTRNKLTAKGLHHTDSCPPPPISWLSTSTMSSEGNSIYL